MQQCQSKEGSSANMRSSVADLPLAPAWSELDWKEDVVRVLAWPAPAHSCKTIKAANPDSRQPAESWQCCCKYVLLKPWPLKLVRGL
jgi:hypothetical protein